MNFINRPQQVCYLPPRVRVVNKYQYRDVIHVQPCHTHFVNNKINCHRIVPKYTCSSEHTCKDVFAGPRCGCKW